MFAMLNFWLVFRYGLTLAFLAGLLFGIREVAAKRPLGWITVALCGMALCEQTGAFAFHFLGLSSFQQLDHIYPYVRGMLVPVGVFALVTPAISLFWNDAKGRPVEQPVWSQGQRLLASAIIAAAILPFSVGLALAMLKWRELFVPTAVASVLAVPGVIVWLLASRYLEKLRVQKDPDERSITLWAYGIASLGSLGALFSALFAFVLLGLQQGWIRP